MASKLSARALAAHVLLEVLYKKRSLTAALQEQLSHCSSHKDRGFIQELCYGALRWYEPLNALARLLVAKPLKPADNIVYCLLLLGLYQLKYLQTKPHAAIYETAQAARTLKKNWAVGFINGVLRTWQREHTQLESKIQHLLNVQFAHPQWLIKMIQQSWPQHWRKILIENNTHPPLTLRVNLLKISRERYLDKLNELNIKALPLSINTAGICLASPQDITQLPGFTEGEFSVQDGAAQLAADLLALEEGHVILDACAAPGGKTAHILEKNPALKKLLAVEKDAQRLTRIKDNLIRLQLFDESKVELITADAIQIKDQQPEASFDRILLDAPCSATGVIRRHPDIKYLRQPEDLNAVAALQMQLLNALWPLVKPGGILLYATCSILPQENELLLQAFIKQHKNVEIVTIDAEWGIATASGRQILPGDQGMDGFYYAKLLKLYETS